MLGERRGQGSCGRAITRAINEMETIMQARHEANRYVPRKDRMGLGAVVLAIVVSLAGACVVIVESTSEPAAHQRLTIATAE